MKKYIKITTVLLIFIIFLGNVVFATEVTDEVVEDTDGTVMEETESDTSNEEEETYDITLNDSYNYGDEKITLEWTGISGGEYLAKVAKVGDYVDYPITQEQVNANWNALRNISFGSRVQSKTMLINENVKWRVMYNDGTTVKVVSTGKLCNTTVRGEDFGWYKWKDPYFGTKWGDSGGWGYFFQIDQIAKCYANYDYVTTMRSLDITTLSAGSHASGPEQVRQKLGYTDPTDVQVSNGTIINDTYGLFTESEAYLLPRYTCGGNFYRAAYWAQNGKIYTTQVYKGGGSKTANVKAVAVLKNDIYQISGDGSEENPWVISTTPPVPKYSIYQKSEHDDEYILKDTTSRLYATVSSPDRANPDKPIAELSLIRGDNENLNLTVNSGDQGTYYEHKIIAKVSTKPQEYFSNEEPTTVTTGVKGYTYCIDKVKDTDPNDDEIKAQQGEEIKIPRKYVNEGYYIHIQAIDYAENTSEILHMPLEFVYRELELFKVYQEATGLDDTGIASKAGWNYLDMDWTSIEIEKDDPSELPEVCFVVDASKSMKGSRMNKVKAGMTMLVNELFDYYPEIKISIVRFWRGTSVDIRSSSNRQAVLTAINNMYTSKKTYAERGINAGIDILLESTQKNKVLIVMADGNANDYPNRALLRAKENGIKTISIMVDYGGIGNYSNSDSKYSVNTGDEEFYNTLAYGIHQEIQDTMMARYYIYRKAEGEQNYTQINSDAIKEPQYSEKTATDNAGPLRPIITLSESANRDGAININIWTEDKGTAYEFYVKFVHPRTSKELESNTVVQEIKTGVKGYAWCITDSATTDPGGTTAELPKSFSKENVGKYLHIRAIDYAGNLGEVCHIKLETSRYISWEELNETKALFCIQHGQAIPAREDGRHLNTVITAGSGKYAIREIVESPKTGDRIGIRFVEGTTTNIYGTNSLYSYTLGKYIISPATPPKRPGKEGNATEQEAYILNFHAQNNSLESAIQKAVYNTEVSSDNSTWTWEETPESMALLAEANAYAAYKRKGYKYSNVKLDTAVYMDTDYEEIVIGPFILDYEPQGMKYKDKILYFARVIGMKVYNQNNEVISELNINGTNIGNIEAEFIYTSESTVAKRHEEIFTKENYKYPVGEEEFYIKLKYKPELENVTQISKIEFIHNQYNADAQYNVLEGTYREVEWIPNEVGKNDSDVLWCRDVENGAKVCIHGKTQRNHIIGCYFYLTARVNQSGTGIVSQKLLDVLWVKSGFETMVQTLEPGSGEGEKGNTDEYTNDEYRLVIDISGNVWNDGMEDKHNGIRENVEKGIEKVEVKIYQVDKNGNNTGKEYSTHTNNVGDYELKDIPKGIYNLVFIYNGQIYKSTKLLVNGTPVDYKNDFTHTKYTNNSVAEETKEARQELNSAYEEIAGNSTAIGGRGTIELEYADDINTSEIQTTTDGYTKQEFQIEALTSSNNIYYPISKKIEIQGDKYIKIVDSKDVNMGLVQRYTTNTNLKTDLYETIFTIKGDKQSYIFSEKNIRDINSNIEKSEYIQEVNWADYNWKLEDLLSQAPDQETKDRLAEILGDAQQSELEGYLDYIIIIRNTGEKDKVQIAELANYYTKDLLYLNQYRDFEMTSWAQIKYDDVKEGENSNKTDRIQINWTTTSKYNKVNNLYTDEYNKIYTTDLDKKELQVQKGEFLELHLVFKINKDTNEKLQLDLDNAGKASMTEINGYKTYYIQDDSIAGLIDINSQPGNANPKADREYYEDDEDKSPTLKLVLSEVTNQDETIDGEKGADDSEEEQTGINRDEEGNIVGYGNVIEGNVWEDLKTTNNIQTLANYQIISDGIRQDSEPLIQNVKVDLIEYFKHPTDSSKDVYMTLKSQNTRAVLSLSNGQELEGGYSFINLPSGSYKVKFIYGNYEQLKENLEKGQPLYNGQDYQGILTQEIYKKAGTEPNYKDIEVMLLVDTSASMKVSIDNVKNIAKELVTGIYTELPNIKVGITRFNDVAEVLIKPTNNADSIQKAIQNLSSDSETAIGFGLEEAMNGYSGDAKQKIMIVLTDSEETMQNVEQVISRLEEASDDKKISLTTILTKENYEIFGTEEFPRRGIVYNLYNADINEIINSISQKVEKESGLEHNRSNAKDLEGDINTPGTRAYMIEKYKVMTLEKAQNINVEQIRQLSDEKLEEALKTLEAETYMQAESKIATFKPNNTKISKIHELNLALMERPKAKLTIETEISAIKILLADNTVLIDTAKGLSKNVNGLDQEKIPITIYMDEEIMHGATLIVTYNIKITNEGKIDTLANYITGGSDSTVTTRAKLVFNYTTKNMLYRPQQNTEPTWDTIEISDIRGSVTGKTIEILKDKDMKVYQTEGFGIELYPKGSKEVLEGTGDSEAKFTVTLSKIITAENGLEDLTFDSSMEIVERENTAGHRSKNEIPGNYEPDTTPIELDSIKSRKIIITKPWGANRRTTNLVVAMVTAIAVASVIGIYLRKKGKNKDVS